MSIKEELKSKLTMSDIEDYDKVGWDDLRLLMGNLGHEVRRNGKEAFMKLHTEHIEEFREAWTHMQFCYLLGFMGTLDPSFHYDESVKMDKYVILKSDMVLLEYGAVSLSELVDGSEDSYINRGFLIVE